MRWDSARDCCEREGTRERVYAKQACSIERARANSGKQIEQIGVSRVRSMGDQETSFMRGTLPGTAVGDDTG